MDRFQTIHVFADVLMVQISRLEKIHYSSLLLNFSFGVALAAYANVVAKTQVGPGRFEMTKPKPVDKYLRDEDCSPTSVLFRLKSKKQLRKFAKKHSKTRCQDVNASALENE
jgi:hypothetical protein